MRKIDAIEAELKAATPDIFNERWFVTASWWQRFRLWFCPMHISVDWSSISSEDNYTCVYYKTLKGVIYIMGVSK